jgi:TolB-like protein/Tfp pilus assembly protein PilF/predicted Ser/Thr protein kinase
VTLAAGTRLGPYEILAPLGAGGMGEVYRARDPRLGREVAIKVLPASFSADPDRLRRFEQEARAAGILNHPNITAVYDIGMNESDGAPYVVQELLEGETLRSRLAEGPLAVRKAIDYALQIAYGLAAAHEKRIVHRDLKPENLFVTKDGRVKILDFGLAKLTHAQEGSAATNLSTATPGTEPGVVLGTLGYMSPEQVRGKPADHRGDIFSFGAILYEMLSGQRAFHGDSVADTMSAILMKEPPDLSVANRDIPAGLERIVRHCLEKNPAERFYSAHDLAFDLEALSDVSAAASGARTIRSKSARRRRLALGLAGVVAAALLVLVAALLWRTRGGKTGAPSAPALDRKSVAVLPFQNLSPDPENAFFADGMTEDILTQLAKIRDLKVISHTSVMRYKGTQKPIQTIASELGVATVLEGSVRRAGNRVRIVGQLIDAGSDEHLWAETYDRELKDVFAIQSEVAQRIATALKAALSPAEKMRIEQSPTQDLAAYDLYLKGRELYNRYRKADNEAAIELFQKALELDPAFALGYAGLGDAYAQRGVRFGLQPSWVDKSLEMSRKAIALNPEVAEGYKALGLAQYFKGKYRESLDATRRAAEINPNYASAVVNVGNVLRNMGRLDEALPWSLRGIELDPTSAVGSASVGSIYAALGDARQAEPWLKRSLELQPDLGQGHHFLINMYLQQRRDEEALRQAHNATTLLPDSPLVLFTAGLSEFVTGNLPRAQQLFEQVLPSFRGVRLAVRNGGAGAETYLAYLLLRIGRRGEAEALLQESFATDRRAADEGNEDWSVPYDAACVHALRGEKDEAFRWLDKAVEAGWRGWPLGTRNPLLDPLRNDPRFQRIEARLQELIGQMRRRAGSSREKTS